MNPIERLVRIYLNSRERLLKDIRRRLAWGRSTGYQEELVALIDQELRKLDLESLTWAKETVEAAYMRGARLAWRAVHAGDRSVKAFASFGGLHKRAVELLAHNTQSYLRITNNLIARQAQDAVRRIGVEITSRKFGEALTWKETTRLLEEKLLDEGFYTVPWRNGRGSMRLDSYAELVARTTTAEATNTGTLNQMREMGKVLVKMTEHNTTCKVCASRQGRVYRTVEIDELPEGDPRRAFPHIREGMPRWPTYKTVHPNCFVSGTPVLAQGVIAHSGRDYVGEIITVTIAGGNKLTVTPNHPILTPEGWVKAGALLKGDKVVKYTRIDDFLVGKHPDDINVPTLIEQVPHALRKALGVSAYSVETTPEQFHGDGTDGKIAVIHSYSLLGNEGNPLLSKEIAEGDLVCGSKLSGALFPKRALLQILHRARHAADSVMGRTCPGKALLWGKPAHSNQASLRACWGRVVSRLFQAKADGHLTDVEMLGNRGFAHPRLIHPDDFISRKRLPVCMGLGVNHGSEVFEPHPFLPGAVFDNRIADTHNGRDLVNSLSGKIEFLDVIDVKHDFFHGIVYNLQTKNGWYLANGIITHNCAHRLLPFIWEQKTQSMQRQVIDKAAEPFAEDPRGEAERIRYEKAQKANADRLRDRKQWERYKAVLGKENVPGFSGFRRMKAASSENYKFMQLDYTRQNRLKQNPNLALPNAGKVIAKTDKFTAYLFNRSSMDGWAKGVAFESRLGYNASNWQALRQSILEAAPKYPAVLRGGDEHGSSYGQNIILKGLKGKPANVVVGWKSQDGKTWMTTAYIKEVKFGDKD